MTDNEAIAAMFQGKKVTHKSFAKDAWMKLEGIVYEFQDGCLCDFSEFWRFKLDDSWGCGWSIFEGEEDKRRQI
jgi:hypothetical protein